jgi:hypothetical protein
MMILMKFDGKYARCNGIVVLLLNLTTKFPKKNGVFWTFGTLLKCVHINTYKHIKYT